MIKNRIAKIAALTVGMTFALGVMATPAGAQTIAELQAQINALMAQLAALQGGGVPSTSTTFTMDLTVGSTGSEVTALQQVLVSGGYLVMPAGVPMGYFGSLTQAAVAKWQMANGVSPAAGYWGPISRAKYASMAGTVVVPPPGGTSTVPGCAPGAMFSSTTGAPCTPGTITTPGVEGTIAATLNPSPASGTKLYEGDVMKAVLGIELEAKTSDIRVERVKLDLDHVTGTTLSDNNLYRKIAKKIYVMDGSTVLGSMDLNINTVVEDGTDRFITIAGLNFVVPKDTKKVLTIALDAMANWDSDFDTETFSLRVPVDGVRGVDGAGVNQYSPSTAFTRNFTTEGELADSATLVVSLNSGTPQTQQKICELGTGNDECDLLEVAKFDFKVEKDAVQVTDFVLDIVRGGALVATATTAYLYDGSTLVGSASVVQVSTSVMTATFSDIDWTVPKDTTRTLSIQFDIDDAALAEDTFVASTDANDITAKNSLGTAVTATGSADGKTMTIRNIGPQLTLVSRSISTNGVPQGAPFAGGTSTSTLTAIFKVNVKAVGGSISLGKVASGTPAFSKTGATNSFLLYKEGAASSVNHATSTSYTIPAACTNSVAESCTLTEGSDVDIEVTYLVPGRLATGVGATTGLYAVGLEKFNWNTLTSAVQTTTFMAGLTEWRTVDVSFP